MTKLLCAALGAAVALSGAAWAAEPVIHIPADAPPLIRASATPVQANASWIGLRNGVEMSFLGAGEISGAGARTLAANFAAKDQAVLKQPAKLIAAADELFGRFVILTADQSGFTRVIINVKKPDSKTATYEDFVYVRGANTVWLRQAGKEKWKVAQDSKFDAASVQVIDVKGVGRIEIEAIAEINAPSGARRALGIDIRTNTPNKNQLQKYREIRAAWLAADREELLKRGFDFVGVQNFSGPRLGRFQVRPMSYVQIQREAGKGWPDMPALPPSPKSKPPLVAEGPALDAEVLTAAIAQAFQLQPGNLADPLASAVAKLELGEASAVAALQPQDMELKAHAYGRGRGDLETVPVPDRLIRRD